MDLGNDIVGQEGGSEHGVLDKDLGVDIPGFLDTVK